MAKTSYYTERNIRDLDKIAELLNDLPPFCEDYFLGIETRTSSQTRLKYAYDLRIFFDYICKRRMRGKTVDTFTLEDLERLEHNDIEVLKDSANGRKLACLCSLVAGQTLSCISVVG